MHVVINCASTLDGAIGLPGPKPLAISGPDDLRRVHRMRAEADAILVGIGTVLADDPNLVVKWDLIGGHGTAPTRVVLDSRSRTPANARVLNDDAPTLILTAAGQGPDDRFVRVAKDTQGRLELVSVLRELSARGLDKLMVEGGSAVITQFLAQGLADELHVYLAPILMGHPGAPRLSLFQETFPMTLPLAGATRVDDGVLLSFVRNH